MLSPLKIQCFVEFSRSEKCCFAQNNHLLSLGLLADFAPKRGAIMRASKKNGTNIIICRFCAHSPLVNALAIACLRVSGTRPHRSENCSALLCSEEPWGQSGQSGRSGQSSARERCTATIRGACWPPARDSSVSIAIAGDRVRRRKGEPVDWVGRSTAAEAEDCDSEQSWFWDYQSADLKKKAAWASFCRQSTAIKSSTLKSAPINSAADQRA